MNVNTHKTMAKTVAGNWKHQYFDTKGGRWYDPIGGSAERTYEKLVSAGRNIAKLLKALPDGGWMEQWCNECGGYKNPTVTFGSDQESTICLDCLTAAVVMASSATERKPRTPK